MHFLKIALAALSALASTTNPAVDLAWNAPAGCPARDVVVTQIEKLSGIARLESPLAVQASATKNADGAWSMHLVTAAGERSFQAETCADLADATAVVVALMVVPVTDRAAPAETPAVRTVVAPSQAKARITIRLRASGSAVEGPLPGLVGSAGIAAGLGIDRLRFEVAGAWGADQQVTLASGAGARLGMPIRGTVKACYAPMSAPVEMEGCAGATVALLEGVGTGVSNPAEGGTWWLGVLGAIALDYPLISWLWLRAEISAGYSPNQARFSIQGVGEVARVAPWVAMGELGVEARF